MKKLFFLILIFPTIIFSQNNSMDFDIEQGAIISKNSEVEMRYFEGDNIFMANYEVDNKGYTLQLKKYNIATKKIIDRKKTEFLVKNANIAGFKKIGKMYFLFYSVWNSKNNSLTIFGKEIDFENMTSSLAKPILSTEEELLSFPKTRTPINAVDSYIDFVLSPDGNKLLIRTEYLQVKEKGQQRYSLNGIYVFDEQLHKLKNSIAEMPDPDVHIDKRSLRFYINNQGIVFFTSKIFISEVQSAFVANKKNYFFKVFQVKNNQINSVSILLEDYNISNIYLAFNKDKVYSLSPAGKGNIGRVNCVLLKILDKDLTEITKKVILLNNDLIGKYERNTKAIESLIGLKIAKIDIDSNGDLFFIAEESYKTGTDVPVYHYNDLYYGFVDENANVKYMSKLPKEQSNKYAMGSNSFTYYKSQNKKSIYLFYVDNYKNVGITESTAPTLFVPNKGGVFSVFKIDVKTGSNETKTVFDLSKTAKNKKDKYKMLYNIYTDDILVHNNGIVIDASISNSERVKIFVDIE